MSTSVFIGEDRVVVVVDGGDGDNDDLPTASGIDGDIDRDD